MSARSQTILVIPMRESFLSCTLERMKSSDEKMISYRLFLTIKSLPRSHIFIVAQAQAIINNKNYR